MNAKKRLGVLERLFAAQLQTRLAELEQLLQTRYVDKTELRAVGECLRFAATGECNPVLARHGATLLEAWGAEVGPATWRELWPIGLDEQVDEAAAVLLSDDTALA